jgi:hypothetical protein
VLAAVLAACKGEAPEPVMRAPSPSPVRSIGVRGKGPMTPIVQSQMGEKLSRIGLDPRKLPPIGELDKSQLLAVMETFTESLGIPCSGCHAMQDMHADTRRKRVAKRMWNDFSRGLAFDNGDALYCDTCHQGHVYLLDRSDKAKLADYMSDQFVGRLKRADGRDHDCGTCHGDPPDFAFLAIWRENPAADIKIVKAPPPRPAEPVAAVPAPVTAQPPARTDARGTQMNVAPITRPRPVASAPTGPCGDKNNPCPLQKWMRQNMATAVSANDSPALAKALEKAATFSPDPSWKWAEIAKTGAEFARQGDISAARKSCKGCHDAYKNQWKQSYRTRPIR